MLRSPNPPTWELLSRLLSNKMVPAPPGVAQLRTAMVRHNVETTYVVTADWPEEDGKEWLLDEVVPAAGSDVQYLIDGPATFEAMGEALETADSADHFILLVAWSLEPDFAFYGSKTFLQVIQERASQHVQVRVLLFNNTEYPVNDGAKTKLNELRSKLGLNVTCELDDRTAGLVESATDSIDLKKIRIYLPSYDRPSVSPDELIPPQYKKYLAKGNPTSYGAHHHKILLVHGRDGLIGFCGGVDLAYNRISYLHDAHLRVTGEAASSLLTIAEQRWSRAQDNGAAVKNLSLPKPTTTTSSSPNYLAAVVQTVGNPDLKPIVANTLWPSIQKAIRRAKRFIYLEDQYFWSFDLARELVEAARRVRHVTILVPAAVVGEHTKLRQKAIGELVRVGGAGIERKIGIYEMKRGGHEWVHAKLFVFDDEYAIVGSANANNRGFFLDSEAAIGVAERGWEKAGGSRRGEWYAAEANFARRMRIELWHEHLGLDHEELFDGTSARVHWDNLPTSANVALYRSTNLKEYYPKKAAFDAQVAQWLAEKKQAESEKKPFQKKFPEWEDPSMDTVKRKPWWMPPADDWDPGWSGEDVFLDPRR